MAALQVASSLLDVAIERQGSLENDDAPTRHLSCNHGQPTRIRLGSDQDAARMGTSRRIADHRARTGIPSRSLGRHVAAARSADGQRLIRALAIAGDECLSRCPTPHPSASSGPCPAASRVRSSSAASPSAPRCPRHSGAPPPADPGSCSSVGKQGSARPGS